MKKLKVSSLIIASILSFAHFSASAQSITNSGLNINQDKNAGGFITVVDEKKKGQGVQAQKGLKENSKEELKEESKEDYRAMMPKPPFTPNPKAISVQIYSSVEEVQDLGVKSEDVAKYLSDLSEALIPVLSKHAPSQTILFLNLGVEVSAIAGMDQRVCKMDYKKCVLVKNVYSGSEGFDDSLSDSIRAALDGVNEMKIGNYASEEAFSFSVTFTLHHEEFMKVDAIMKKAYKNQMGSSNSCRAQDFI